MSSCPDRLMPVVQPSKAKRIPGYDANHRWIECSWQVPGWLFGLAVGFGLGVAIGEVVL